MKDHVLLSILIPCYNVKDFLPTCLDSILYQNANINYEIIIVDDGSTDGSGDICDWYSNKFNFIKTIHKKNQGLLYARSDAIKVAKGEYCAFVDSDDFVDSNYLEIISQTIENNKHPDLIMFNFNFCDLDNNLINNSNFSYFNLSLENILSIRQTFLTTSSLNALWKKVVKTSVLQSDPTDYSGFPKQMGEDKSRSYHIFDKAKDIVFIEDKIYFYRKNPNSLTGQPTTFESVISKETKYITKYSIEYLAKWKLDINLKQHIYDLAFSNFYHLSINILSKLKYTDFKRLFLTKNIESLFFGFNVKQGIRKSNVQYYMKLILKKIFYKRFFQSWLLIKILIYLRSIKRFLTNIC